MRRLNAMPNIYLSFLIFGTCALSAQLSEDPIEEEINVFESRITLDFPGLSYREASRIKAPNLVIIEGGAPREVTSLEPLAEAGDWRTIVYVDAPTTRAQTIRTAALALGGFVERFTQLGTVEIVVADLFRG